MTGVLCTSGVVGVIKWNAEGSGCTLVDILSWRVPGGSDEDHVNSKLG